MANGPITPKWEWAFTSGPTETLIKASSSLISEKAKVHTFGKIKPSLKAGGRPIISMEKPNSPTRMTRKAISSSSTENSYKSETSALIFFHS